MACGDHSLAIAAEFCSVDGAFMGVDGMEIFPGTGIPDADGLIGGGA